MENNVPQTETKTRKCTPAQLAYRRAYYAANKEKYLAYSKQYYSAHKEDIKSRVHDYSVSHREQRSANYRKLYADNPIYRQNQNINRDKYQSKVPLSLSHRIREWLDDNGYISYVGHHFDYSQPFKVIVVPKAFHQNLHSYLEKVEVDGFETYQRKSDKHLLKDAKEALNYSAFLLNKEGFDFKPFILDFVGLFPTVVDIE